VTKLGEVDDVATHASVWIHKHHKPSKLVTVSSTSSGLAVRTQPQEFEAANDVLDPTRADLHERGAKSILEPVLPWRS
jgi:hypothetical protein